MPKYFFTHDQMHGTKITLDGETAHHLLHVLRMNPGEKMMLCDGAETDYLVTIEEANPKRLQVICRIESTAPSLSEPLVNVTLYQGLPKADKLELIIQKCVELGVSEIIPVITSRSVVRTKSDKKNVRYQRIAESAAGQSMRGIIPRVSEAIAFDDAVKRLAPSDLTLVAYEAEQTRTLKAVLSQNQSRDINIWIGPEGGFTNDEIAALRSQGATVITLGKRILRTETAAISMLAQVLCLAEN